MSTSNKENLRLGLIGHPLSHSKSPEIFAYLSQLTKTKVKYDLMDTPSDKLSDQLEVCRGEYDGCNVTVPYKEDLFQKADETTDEAKTIGAANILKFADGKVIAHNSDAAGFKKSLKLFGVNVEGESCLVFGAGGAAKAVVYALGELGASRIIVLNRNEDRANALIKDLTPKFPDTDLTTSTDQISNSKVVINATSVGMSSGRVSTNANAAFSALSELNSGVAIDIVYSPLNTVFLKFAQKQGLKVFHGLDMLIYQALESWNFWGGPKVDEDAARLGLNLELRGKKIILCGFMGSGKTEVGKALARKLDCPFTDLDENIKRASGKSIQEIFEKGGEAKFREMEKTTLKDALSFSEDLGVLSLGGGALETPENLDLVLENGQLIFLDTPKDELLARLDREKSNRPLLVGKNRQEIQLFIDEKMLIRRPQYERCDIKIDVDKKDVPTVVNEIFATLQKAGVDKPT